MFSRTLANSIVVQIVAAAAVTSGCGSENPSQPSQAPAVLTVTSVTPRIGPTEGRVTVRIVGTGFQPGALVTLDGAATNVVISGSTVVWATVPAHAEGTVDLVVTNPDGQSARLGQAFTYSRMAVTSVQPASGTIGKWVRIFGVGFLHDTEVTFGGTRATRVIVESLVSIFAVAPSHEMGAVDVTVRNTGGLEATVPGAFTYYPVTLTVTPTVVRPGGELTVSWTAPAGQSEWDWVGLYKVGEPNTKMIFYEYTAASSGSRTFAAPAQPGQYEFRYLVDDDYNDAARAGPITVVGGSR